eukprot:3245450-Pyramimonas_sp.AAC.1
MLRTSTESQEMCRIPGSQPISREFGCEPGISSILGFCVGCRCLANNGAAQRSRPGGDGRLRRFR